MQIKLLLSILVCASLYGCTSDFDKYNFLQGPRLLAIRAEPSTVAIGESTIIDTLIYAPEDANISYSWSWCPLRAGPTQSWQCSTSQEQLNSLLISFGYEGEPLGYSLGNTPTITFNHMLAPEMLAQLCMNPGDMLANTAMPNCDQGYPISIELNVDIDGHQIRAFKEVNLALSQDGPVNTNPRIDGVSFGIKNTPHDEAIAVDENDVPALREDTKYKLYADVPEESSEMFIRSFTASGKDPYLSKEGLILTWFIGVGETKFMRTNFVENELGYDVLTANEWEIPPASEIKSSIIPLYLVLRDERGGVGWLQRSFTVEQ
ncbi:MAG: hypothetical protein JW841_12780 [Deltaproteobacteria bacterium]|nr:hypothetical protein [Deltaproteobacteria bacterium]